MSREQWDREAEHFDEEPDHGLRDPAVRTAWRDLLGEIVPPSGSAVADLGCGTGSVAGLLVELGHRVDGVDFSPEMVRRARTKMPEATFRVGDAAVPPLSSGAYDVVFCRHVLWALPEPVQVVGRWAALLRPGGVMVLVEGNWHTGAGLTAHEAERIVRAAGRDAEVRALPDPALWGGPISDERYVLVSRG